MCGMTTKSAVSGISYLQYEERKHAIQGGSHLQYEKKGCSVRRECTVSEGHICTRKTGCVFGGEIRQ